MDKLADLIDIEHASAAFESDKERILDMVRALEGGVEGVNSMCVGAVTGAKVGISVSADVYLPVARAALTGDMIPLDAVADKNAALCYATTGGYVAVMRALLAGGADTEPEILVSERVTTTFRAPVPESLINLACKSGNVGAVKLLVENNVDPSQPNKQGWSPIHSAAMGGHIPVLKLLVQDHGCDPNTTVPGFGTQPLHTASFKGHLAAIKLLLEVGADCTAELFDMGGPFAEMGRMRPVALASEFGHLEAVRCLLDAKSDVNGAGHAEGDVNYSAGGEDNKGSIARTVPLYHAVRNNQLELVNLLVSRGADVGRCFREGSSLIDGARDTAVDPAILEALLAAHSSDAVSL